jgi:uncharacterized protein YfkK (UPF0435 family)
LIYGKIINNRRNITLYMVNVVKYDLINLLSNQEIEEMIDVYSVYLKLKEGIPKTEVRQFANHLRRMRENEARNQSPNSQ